MGPFCSSCPFTGGDKGTLKVESCFQSKPTPWAGRKISKMEKSLCARPGPAPLQPRNVFHVSVLGVGWRHGRDVTEQGASCHIPEVGW